MKLYYENRLDNIKEKSFDEVLVGYSNSSYNTEDYPTARGLSLYIASKDGLNSSFDEDEFEELLAFRTNNREKYISKGIES